jgi:hypothetical protein
MARDVGGIPSVRSVSAVSREPTIPSEGRRYPLPELGSQSDQEKLEDYPKHDQPGTLPERIIIQWALDQRLTFYIQKRIYGSYTMFMSALVDMLILNYPGIAQPIILRVNGQYWHNGSKSRRDDAQRLRLQADGYRVVDLWVPDIYRALLDGRLDGYVDDAIRRPI